MLIYQCSYTVLAMSLPSQNHNVNPCFTLFWRVFYGPVTGWMKSVNRDAKVQWDIRK